MRSLRRLLLAVAVIGSWNVNLFGRDDREHLSATPPMGWNSWDSYGTTVQEDQVKANAEAMARTLARYGWKYIVVDIRWYEPNAQGHQYKRGAHLNMDEYGRLFAAVNRFPSSTGGQGFKPLG